MRSLRLGAALPPLLLALATSLSAQDGGPHSERWQLTFAGESYLWDVRLVRLTGDTLVVRSRDSLITTSVDSLAELRLLPETVLKVGDGHRSGVGALATTTSARST